MEYIMLPHIAHPTPQALLKQCTSIKIVLRCRGEGGKRVDLEKRSVDLAEEKFEFF